MMKGKHHDYSTYSTILLALLLLLSFRPLLLLLEAKGFFLQPFVIMNDDRMLISYHKYRMGGKYSLGSCNG